MGKRGTDHTWELVKYNGDLATYAKCKCGFRYACSSHRFKGLEIISEFHFYCYCPTCGAKKKWVTAGTREIDKYADEDE